MSKKTRGVFAGCFMSPCWQSCALIEKQAALPSLRQEQVSPAAEGIVNALLAASPKFDIRLAAACGGTRRGTILT